MPQQVNAIQKVCSYSPLFTGLICHPKDEMEITPIPQECLCSLCKNAGSCARLTEIYTNALLYICELEFPTDRAVGSTIPADSTIFTIASNLTCDLCWWCEFIFCATGRFVHTLTDQILNTNVYHPWLFSRVVAVVVIVVVYSLLLFMLFMSPGLYRQLKFSKKIK